jgi:hypothetical protein
MLFTDGEELVQQGDWLAHIARAILRDDDIPMDDILDPPDGVGPPEYGPDLRCRILTALDTD